MRKRYLLLILASLLGLALMAVNDYTRQQTGPVSERQASEPDYYGEGLHSRQFDQQGQLQQQLTASHSKHYPLSGNTVFQAPVIAVSDDQQSQWQVTAQEGNLNDSSRILSLHRQVRIAPDPNSDSTSDTLLEVRTEYLDYHLDQQIAETDRLVEIDYPPSFITSQGMRLDVRNQRMELNSKVTTRHVPE